MPAAAVADTYSYYYESLEWLTDASDSIVEATVTPSPYTGRRSDSKITVTKVTRVLKQVGKGGPVAGTELPCQVAPGKEHRVLLLTRPVAKKPGVREAYCVFLTPDPTPKAKQGDPFKRLPSDTSAHQGPEFSHAACVAITHAGKVLTDPDAVVRLVEARVKADPTRVSAAGHYAECGPEADDGDVHNLFVPADR